MKKILSLMMVCTMLLTLFAGCGAKNEAPAQTEPATEAVTEAPETEATEAETTEPAVEAEPEAAALPDGVYTAKFDSDSSMFHANEACEGKGVLTVKDGEMTLHVTLAGKGILNLFVGTAEDAQKDGAELLQPSEDEVTFPDGMKETAYGFDIPVPYLDEEFDCALIGSKGKWYDHKVSVSEAVPMVPELTENGTMEVTLAGGTGKVTIESPAQMMVDENGNNWVTLVWSSKKLEYMLVDGVQYNPINEPGECCVFQIPVVLDEDMAVSALTVAMSEPHLVDYTLHFDSATAK